MFVIPTPNIPPQFKLFELIGNDYYLNFLDGMTGRVALATGITRPRRAARPGEARRQRRTRCSSPRKRAARSSSARPRSSSSSSRRRRCSRGRSSRSRSRAASPAQIDWTLTIIAAFSFLLHFGIVGAMYSDWMDPGRRRRRQRRRPDRHDEEHPAAAAGRGDERRADRHDDRNVDGRSDEARHVAGEVAGHARARSATRKAAALAQQAEAMQMQMLAAFGGNVRGARRAQSKRHSRRRLEPASRIGGRRHQHGRRSPPRGRRRRDHPRSARRPQPARSNRRWRRRTGGYDARSERPDGPRRHVGAHLDLRARGERRGRDREAPPGLPLLLQQGSRERPDDGRQDRSRDQDRRRTAT